MLHFVCIVANFPSEKDVFPVFSLRDHPEKFLISCCVIPRFFPTSTNNSISTFTLSSLPTEEKEASLPPARWGIQWNEVRTAIEYTFFMSCLLKGTSCWCEGIFFILGLGMGHMNMAVMLSYWCTQGCELSHTVGYY